MQKTIIPQAESKSADLIAQNLEQLKQIFPEVVKEGKVDFEALNDLLGNYGDTAEERFALNWAGKANARREAQKRSTGTLRPCPEESVDWDTTDNLYIEGDNLEVLKLLQKSYHSRVKMIYIDPPYNTGKDFVYKDNYTDNMKNYLELTGQDKKLSTNTESDGRYHSNWLNMMYPRLKLARNLLTDDGVIFISIDDNEVANLRKICDEIFGEENFVDCLKWKRKKQPSFLAKHTAQVMEYILVYGKNAHFLEKLSIEGTSDSTKKVVNLTNQYSERIFPKGVLVKIGEEGVLPKGKYLIKSMSIEYMDDVAYRNGKTINEVRVNAQFSVSQEKINEYVLNELLFITANKGLRRDVGQDEIGKRKSITDLLLDWGDNQDSDNEIKSLFNKSYFDYTKPTKLLSNLVKSNFTEASIILDFFSGSATTAHAVMQLNAEDGGNRKYICVQLPEVTPEESEARKAGYTTIPEIAKERIRRAGKKILEEQKAKAEKEGNLFTEEEPNKLDTGFKVFKLDSSNINAWDSDPDNLETALNKSLFNIKEDRSEDDLLYEILIKYGIELTEKIKRHTIDGKTVYEMGAGSLIVCLADSLSTAVADGIGKLYKEVSPEGIDGNCRVVFKEAGFNGSDEVKTNTLLILKQHGITNVASV
ncbi:MAG: site-specific DNA-methyltransferase [Petrimonas sp.]|jgi:adenine-specific DNA-methyltransferase|nr:site-specific DNA-methyltransferase [Petrimonas sp.]